MADDGALATDGVTLFVGGGLEDKTCTFAIGAFRCVCLDPRFLDSAPTTVAGLELLIIGDAVALDPADVAAAALAVLLLLTVPPLLPTLSCDADVCATLLAPAPEPGDKLNWDDDSPA